MVDWFRPRWMVHCINVHEAFQAISHRRNHDHFYSWSFESFNFQRDIDVWQLLKCQTPVSEFLGKRRQKLKRPFYPFWSIIFCIIEIEGLTCGHAIAGLVGTRDNVGVAGAWATKGTRTRSLRFSQHKIHSRRINRNFVYESNIVFAKYFACSSKNIHAFECSTSRHEIKNLV